MGRQRFVAFLGALPGGRHRFLAPVGTPGRSVNRSVGHSVGALGGQTRGRRISKLFSAASAVSGSGLRLHVFKDLWQFQPFQPFHGFSRFKQSLTAVIIFVATVTYVTRVS